MRLDAIRSSNRPLNRFNLQSPASTATWSPRLENHVNARSCYNLQPSIKTSANEEVTREKREREDFPPILPAAS